MTKLKALLYACSSMTIGIVALLFLFIIVLIGTFAQIKHGIFYVQETIFNPWFITIPYRGMTLPVFPGGALAGLVLLVNLILSTALRIKWHAKKSGLFLVHLGLVILLLGGGLTSCVSRESQLYLEEGDSSFYSEDFQATELVIIDGTHPNYDFLTAVPASVIKKQPMIMHDSLPFDIEVLRFYDNAQLKEVASESRIPAAETGIGAQLTITPLERFTKDDQKNNVSCLLRFHYNGTTTGTYLFSIDITGTQRIDIDGRPFYIQLRPTRYYFPFKVTLKTFSHDVYPGSTIPKNYSSLLEIHDFESDSTRDVLVYMNHPFRSDNYTFYQASFGQDKPSSVLQVVYNPTWLVPYLSCIIISIGLTLHFLIHLLAFLRRRKMREDH